MASEPSNNQELEFYRRIMALVECMQEIDVERSIEVAILTINHQQLNYQRNIENKSLQHENKIDLVLLSETLSKTLNQAELKSLVFRLSIDYENLGGQTKNEKIQSLVEYCSRHNCIEMLVKVCNQIRPNIDWLNLKNTPYYENNLDARPINLTQNS